MIMWFPDVKSWNKDILFHVCWIICAENRYQGRSTRVRVSTFFVTGSSSCCASYQLLIKLLITIEATLSFKANCLSQFTVLRHKLVCSGFCVRFDKEGNVGGRWLITFPAFVTNSVILWAEPTRSANNCPQIKSSVSPNSVCDHFFWWFMLGKKQRKSTQKYSRFVRFRKSCFLFIFRKHVSQSKIQLQVSGIFPQFRNHSVNCTWTFLCILKVNNNITLFTLVVQSWTSVLPITHFFEITLTQGQKPNKRN